MRMHIKTEAAERHTLAVIVDNEPGILARIAGLFTARGYNIESLTVSEITADKTVSRITIVTSASPATMEQIIAQLDRLVPVHKVTDLTAQGAHVERELALIRSPAPAITGSRRCASPTSIAPAWSMRPPPASSSR
jgi:acetolactate synthase-1/3 small subunit